MQINMLNGITRVIGHVKAAGSDKDYEPAIYIINERSPRFGGLAFIIALSAMWKYVQPFYKYSEPKLIERDRTEFEETKARIMQEREDLGLLVLPGMDGQAALFKNNQEIACLIMADALSRSNGLLLITGFNLARCMQMFEITPDPRAAAQLLMFIEDALDDMKNLGPAEPDKMFDAGGITLMVDGQKVASTDWKVPESDVIEERYQPDDKVIPFMKRAHVQ